MDIGIIGAGAIGSTLAELFAKAGHNVAISNSRGPETLTDLVSSLGPRVKAVRAEEAAAFGSVVVIPIVYARYRDLPAEALAGKIVVDTNNYWAYRDGDMPELTGRTQSELIRDVLPKSRLVKAFNMIFFERFRDEGKPAGDPNRLAIPVSSDDAEAKKVVSGLIDEIGFDAVDAGTLVEGGRNHEMGTPVFLGDAPASPYTKQQLRSALGLSAS